MTSLTTRPVVKPYPMSSPFPKLKPYAKFGPGCIGTKQQGNTQPLLLGGLLALTGVALGAWGAHGLAGYIGAEAAQSSSWSTAVAYQMYHALALLVMGVWIVVLLSGSGGVSVANGGNDIAGEVRKGQVDKCIRRLQLAALGLFVGVILFSGSIYLLTLGGPRWLGPVTPLGGSLLIISWLMVVIVAYQSRHESVEGLRND